MRSLSDNESSKQAAVVSVCVIKYRRACTQDDPAAGKSFAEHFGNEIVVQLMKIELRENSKECVMGKRKNVNCWKVQILRVYFPTF